METTTVLSRLQRMDYLIRQKATGTARELAGKLEITERSVFNYLDLMRNFGAPVVYSIPCQSYIYETDGGFHIGYIDPDTPSGTE